MALISAINKLRRRKKRGDFYHGTDILTYKEKESLFLIAVIITLPILVTGVMLILN